MGDFGTLALEDFDTAMKTNLSFWHFKAFVDKYDTFKNIEILSNEHKAELK